jgi:hypothetical protein
VAARDSDGLVDGRFHLSTLIQKRMSHRLQHESQPSNKRELQPPRLGGTRAGCAQGLLGLGMVDEPGGHLQVDGGSGGQRSCVERGLAGLREPVERTAAEQVDGAQLVEGSNAPQGEAVRFGEAEGGVERPRGRGEVTLAVPSAKDFKGIAGDFRSARRPRP